MHPSVERHCNCTNTFTVYKACLSHMLCVYEREEIQ